MTANWKKIDPKEKQHFKGSKSLTFLQGNSWDIVEMTSLQLQCKEVTLQPSVT